MRKKLRLLLNHASYGNAPKLKRMKVVVRPDHIKFNFPCLAVSAEIVNLDFSN